MTYVVKDTSLVGYQPIADTSTTQNHPLGTVTTAVDATIGGGEFIYLSGIASTAVGSWVTYDADDFSTTLIVANAVGPVAVAMSANVADQYGWYQIGGKVNAKSNDVADGANVYIDATIAGSCDDAFVAGDYVWRAKWASADDTSTGTADVSIARPFVNDGDDDDTA